MKWIWKYQILAWLKYLETIKHKQTQTGLLEPSKYEINFSSNVYTQLPNKFTEQATKIIKYWILQSSGYMSPDDSF